MTFRTPNKHRKSLGLDKTISEILKPLKMVLCSTREIVSFKLKKKKLAGLQVYYTASNEPIYAPNFEWPDNTFKELKIFFYLHPIRYNVQTGNL